ncbi:hypothetical protein SAMN05421770_103214 [Granulicella rosea]|uniref:Uncharacterized protein n=1 Tax=Granulicella rosea TaxID=474952 RepID=A0A239IR26_9BACT|nr:hypothetical protein SAMN05421770_103214 [Granulicella rosea]
MIWLKRFRRWNSTLGPAGVVALYAATFVCAGVLTDLGRYLFFLTGWFNTAQPFHWNGLVGSGVYGTLLGSWQVFDRDRKRLRPSNLQDTQQTTELD